MSGPSRAERFVRSARTLLIAQVGAAAMVSALAVWAAVEVQGVVDENERLEERVAELQRARAAAPPAVPTADISSSDAPLVADEPAAPAETAADTASNEIRGDIVKDDTSARCQAPDGRAVVCVPPFLRLADGQCRDGNGQPVRCPSGLEDDTPAAPPPPPPARDCRNALGRAIECVPPFRAAPAAGLCIDGRRRLIRCPPGEPRGELEPRPQQKQRSERPSDG